MPRSKEDQNGVKRLMEELLASPAGESLLERVRQDSPGTPCMSKRRKTSGVSVPLTSKQRGMLFNLVASVHWARLSPEDQERYRQGCESARPASPPVPCQPPAKEESQEEAGSGASSQSRQLKRRADSIWDLLERSSSSAADAMQALRLVFEMMERKWPGSCESLRPQPPLAQQQCSQCKAMLTGLAQLEPFQKQVQLTKENKWAQQHLDFLVREVFQDQSAAADLGYPMGSKRWPAAATKPERKDPGGRPSKVQSPEVVAAVQAALDRHSQPSSSVCKKGSLSQLISKFSGRLQSWASSLAPGKRSAIRLTPQSDNTMRGGSMRASGSWLTRHSE